MTGGFEKNKDMPIPKVITCSLVSTELDLESEAEPVPQPPLSVKAAPQKYPEQECASELTVDSVRNALGIKRRMNSYGSVSAFGCGPKPRNCLINFDHAMNKSKNANVYEEFKALKAKKPQNLPERSRSR